MEKEKAQAKSIAFSIFQSLGLVAGDGGNTPTTTFNVNW